MEKLTLQSFPYKFWIKHSNHSYTIIKSHKASPIVLYFSLWAVISIGEFQLQVLLLEELTWLILHHLSPSLTQELAISTWTVSFLVKYSQDFLVIASWTFKIFQSVLVVQQQTGRLSHSTSQTFKYSSNLKIIHTVKTTYVHIFLELSQVSTRYSWETFSLETT